MIPSVPAPTTTATSSLVTSSSATAWRQQASGSIEGARSNGKPSSGTAWCSGTTIHSARPPSRWIPMSTWSGHRFSSPSAHDAHRPQPTFGCRPTSVPSSRTPATSWPGILGVGVPWVASRRSVAQIAAARTRTDTSPAVAFGSGTSSVATRRGPSIRTALIPRACHGARHRGVADARVRCRTTPGDNGSPAILEG